MNMLRILGYFRDPERTRAADNDLEDAVPAFHRIGEVRRLARQGWTQQGTTGFWTHPDGRIEITIVIQPPNYQWRPPGEEA